MKTKVEGVVKDFKKFINRGNILDLATGIIIGGAFTAIVNSLVNDIIMPLISRAIEFDLTTAKLVLKEAVLDSEGETIKNAITLNYGNFLQSFINFIIIPMAIFFAVKVVKSIRQGYVKNQIKYVKNLKKKHPEWFDEEDEYGTKLYERLKKEHPEYFKNEIAEEIEKQKEEAKKEDPVRTNNELLLRLNENLEKMCSIKEEANKENEEN